MQILRWVWRAWPFLILGLIGISHYWLIHSFLGELVIVNKATGAAMQIIGGLIVLNSINANLGIMRNQTLDSIFLGYLRDFPLIRHKVNLTAVVTGGMTAGALISAVVTRATNPTIEERIVKLEKQIEDVRLEIQVNNSKISKRIDDVKTELLDHVSSNQAEVQQLSEQVRTVTVDGFKQQAFGVLLVIYGAFVSLFA